MPLPSPISKTNCDASTDDPKLALLVDLAAAIDTINALIASVQPLDDELTTLSGISPAQAVDLAALSAFMGTVLNDASAAVALATLGAPLNAVAAKSAAYTIVAADRGKLIDYTSGSYTLGIDAAATLGAGFVFAYRNSGSGTITIDPNGSEQIDGATTLSVGPGESGFAVCTGTAWRTVGRVVAPAANPLAVTTLTSGTSHTLNSKTTRVQVEMVGGGGGGGSRDGSGNAGAGGGSGAYLKTGILSTGAASTLAYAVGSGGGGGKSLGAGGGAGGSSSVTINGTTFTAAGGGGGQAGGTGGAGGGLSAASADRICIVGTAGANFAAGGAAGAASIFSTTAGPSGNNVYGGGGGGSPATVDNGGNGGAGLVKITEYA